MPFRVLAVLLVTAILGGACTDSSLPAYGYEFDAGADVVEDSSNGDEDKDWLCNGSEPTYGTDPKVADSDGDGFDDWFEVLYGSDALQPASPDRARMVVLREAEGARATMTFSIDVSGTGESYDGAFEAIPLVSGSEGASDFFDEAVALAASPGDHVGTITGETFRSVGGRTLLLYELRFAYSGVDRLCTRAHPFAYSVKRSDGVWVASDEFLLVVLPLSDTLVSGEWCAPVASCF